MQFISLIFIILVVGFGSSADQSVRYDKNVNLFSSSGELLQVQYARNAGLRGSPVLCSQALGNEVIICIPTMPYLQALQDRRSVDKVAKVCDGVWFTFAGLAGDGRALLKAARSFALEYQTKFGSAPTVRSVARYIGELQHECTLTGGRRPFGVQVLLIGVDDNAGNLTVYNSEPSGETSTWRAVAIGKNADKNMRRLEQELQAIKGTVETANLLATIGLSHSPSNQDEEEVLSNAPHKDSTKSKETQSAPNAVDLYRFRSTGSGSSLEKLRSPRMTYYSSVEELTRSVELESAKEEASPQ